MAKASSGPVRLRLVGARELPSRPEPPRVPPTRRSSRVPARASPRLRGLYRRHAAFALNLAVHIQGTTADVEDIVHDAFVRAHERLAELRDTSAFRAWLGASSCASSARGSGAAGCSPCSVSPGTSPWISKRRRSRSRSGSARAARSGVRPASDDAGRRSHRVDPASRGTPRTRERRDAHGLLARDGETPHSAGAKLPRAKVRLPVTRRPCDAPRSEHSDFRTPRSRPLRAHRSHLEAPAARPPGRHAGPAPTVAVDLDPGRARGDVRDGRLRRAVVASRAHADFAPERPFAPEPAPRPAAAERATAPSGEPRTPQTRKNRALGPAEPVGARRARSARGSPPAMQSVPAGPPEWEKLADDDRYNEARAALETHGGFSAVLGSASATQLMTLADIARRTGSRDRDPRMAAHRGSVPGRCRGTHRRMDARPPARRPAITREPRKPTRFIGACLRVVTSRRMRSHDRWIRRSKRETSKS